MGADSSLLQGEVVENPVEEHKDVEALLLGFLQALIKETEK